jgi:hypothetical protein
LSGFLSFDINFRAGSSAFFPLNLEYERSIYHFHIRLHWSGLRAMFRQDELIRSIVRAAVLNLKRRDSEVIREGEERHA